MSILFPAPAWLSERYSTVAAYCTSPVIADLADEGSNTLYLGARGSLGVVMLKYSGGWPAYSILPGSTGNGDILAMKAGGGRERRGDASLSASHGSSSGLVEYSWNSGTSTYDALQLMSTNVGRIGIGSGRMTASTGIYAVERGGGDVHEFSWDGSAFVDTVIFTGSAVSNGSAYVADGRGDGVQRVYVWAGGLYELTWEGGAWVSFTMNADS